MTTPAQKKKEAAAKASKQNQEKGPKKGLRSTEFWLAAATSLLSLLIMAGVIDLEGATTVDKIAGLAAAALASMGYSLSRGLAKHKATPPSE